MHGGYLKIASSGHAGPTKGSEVHFDMGDEGSPVDKGQQDILDLDRNDMAINRKLCLTPKKFEKLQEYVEFKADFHHVSIQGQKDPEQKWHNPPYVATDDEIAVVLEY